MGEGVASCVGEWERWSGRVGSCAARVAVALVEVEVMSVHSSWWWSAWVVKCGLWVVFAWVASVARSMRMLSAYAGARARVRGCGRVR